MNKILNDLKEAKGILDWGGDILVARKYLNSAIEELEKQLSQIDNAKGILEVD